MNIAQDIVDFHERFENAYRGPARQLPDDLQSFRTKFLQEELSEYIDAVKEKDLGKQFDALIDLVYVAIGTMYLNGFPLEKGWALVHAANMSKIKVKSASESKRGSEHDVIKPPNWTPPDLSAILV